MQASTHFLAAAGVPTLSCSDNTYHLLQHYDSCLSSPLASTQPHVFGNDPQFDATLYHNALVSLQHRQHQHQHHQQQRQQRSVTSNAVCQPASNTSPTAILAASPHRVHACGSQQATAAKTATHDWQMCSAPYSSMGGHIASRNQGLKRARSHQRTPSASTTGSNGPASPFMHTPGHPHIASLDRDPNTPSHYTEQPFFSKNPPTPLQTPTESGFSGSNNSSSSNSNNYHYALGHVPHVPSAHMAMKGFAIDHHLADDFAPEYAPSRQSMSSYGNDSPATPQSGTADVDMRSYGTPAHDMRPSHPSIHHLYRTESAAYQDELYNPNAVYASASMAKSNPGLLSPHRNHQLSERLQTANMQRSVSPAPAVSRERSPFREGSDLALNRDWPSSIPQTAADMRKQQKEQSAQAEYAQYNAPPLLRREPTKTVSPKETFLDYNDPNQPSLFQDSIPAGYKAHSAGTEQWPTNFLSQPTTTYNHIPHANEQGLNATSAEYSVPTGFDFAILPHSEVQNGQLQANYHPSSVPPKMHMGYPPVPDQTPDFPAQLPSMETSISDLGATHSSQETDFTSPPHRPDDTRANTGTYTCTYHGCTYRFTSLNSLQRHKRDFHRSQQQQQQQQPQQTQPQQQGDGASSSAAGSMSPSSTESPAPSAGGLTSAAAILARNSQAGPHKCTRINPSTNKPCNTIFSRPYDLTRHEDTIHNNRKQKVRCPMCREEKTFSRNDALTRHMRVVHPEVEAFGKRGRRGE